MNQFLYILGKLFKYSVWTYTTIFFYHYYLVKKTAKPEEGFLAIEFFLKLAKRVDWHVYDIYLLLTEPPVRKLLGEKPPLPPGAVFPKTLILNLKGTLVHAEYKFGEGFSYSKRPGLTNFL